MQWLVHRGPCGCRLPRFLVNMCIYIYVYMYVKMQKCICIIYMYMHICVCAYVKVCSSDAQENLSYTDLDRAPGTVRLPGFSFEPSPGPESLGLGGAQGGRLRYQER